MPVTINGAGLASGVTSVPNLQSFPAGPRLANVNMPVGSVLQIVTATISSSLTTSSTSAVASTLIATITPSSSASKIFVLLNGGGIDSNSANNTQVTYMYRNIAGAGYSLLSQMEVFFFPSGNAYGGHSFNYLDSPATTSSISYQPYYKVAGGAGSVWFNNNSGVISLTLMEIAA